MKKFLAILAAFVLAAPSFAQVSSGGFSMNEESLYYGIRLGVTTPSISGDQNTGTKVGMTLGGVVGLRLSPSTPIFLESGFYYTQRGGKDSNRRVHLDYLEIPVLIKYGFSVGSDIAILPFVGPHFSYGIAGKMKEGEAEERSSYNNDVGFRHFDMGFKAGAGIEWRNLYAELGYQFGVANISAMDKKTSRGNAFFANIGVNF